MVQFFKYGEVSWYLTSVATVYPSVFTVRPTLLEFESLLRKKKKNNKHYLHNHYQTLKVQSNNLATIISLISTWKFRSGFKGTHRTHDLWEYHAGAMLYQMIMSNETTQLGEINSMGSCWALPCSWDKCADHVSFPSISPYIHNLPSEFFYMSIREVKTAEGKSLTLRRLRHFFKFPRHVSMLRTSSSVTEYLKNHKTYMTTRQNMHN